MAKTLKTRKVRKEEVFPFEKHNYVIIGLGIVAIVAGYFALMEKSVEGFLPLYLAPILLVLGYCILIPIGILFTPRGFTRKKERSSPDSDQSIIKG